MNPLSFPHLRLRHRPAVPRVVHDDAQLGRLARAKLLRGRVGDQVLQVAPVDQRAVQQLRVAPRRLGAEAANLREGKKKGCIIRMC